jgi:hypothetical protein
VIHISSAFVLKGDSLRFKVIVYILTPLESDIVLELATREDRFFMNTVHLILEVKLNGQVIDEASLFRRKFTPGVWDAEKPVVM